MAAHKRQVGVALVETAIVLPLLCLLILGGISLGLGMVKDMRLEHATAEAVKGAATGILGEADVTAHIASLGGSVECFALVPADPPCLEDGLAIVPRVQLVVAAPVDIVMLGQITVKAGATSLLGG